MRDIHYLDYASTSYPVHYFAKDYYIPGNPNSSHTLGLQANQSLNEARQRIMNCLGVKSGKVLFCRCATEAVEWLCRQFHQYGDNLYTYASPYDHDSVTNNCCDVENIEECIAWEYLSRNYIYLHQHTNHITGTVFDIESIGKQVQSTGAFFGSDITAGLGKYPLPNNIDIFCDAVWFSGHKIHCETMGAIWLSDRLFKYLGGDEDSRNNYGLLHGTPNVSAAVAMSCAMEYAIANATNNWIEHRGLASKMLFDLEDKGIEVRLVCDESLPKAHSINALYLSNINGDALTQYLSTKSTYISPGHSACADNDDYHVLEAFGLTKEQASQTVRISFGEDTTEEDIDALINGIIEFKNLFI